MTKYNVCGECAYEIDRTGHYAVSNAIVVPATLKRDELTGDVADPVELTERPCELCDIESVLFPAQLSSLPA